MHFRMHNNGIALLTYAADNKGALPQIYASPLNLAYHLANPAATGTSGGWPTGCGTWIWDMNAPTRNAFIRYGCTRASFYCPSNTAQNNNVLWNFGVTATINGAAVNLATTGTDANGFSYDGPPNMPDEIGFGVMGYVWLITRIDGSFPTPALPYNNHWDYQSKLRPNNTAASNGAVRPNVSATTEISTDAVVSTNSLTTPNFGDVVGGWSQPHQTSHWSGGLPLGGNILYLDGHVAWKNANIFHAVGSGQQMYRRTTTPLL